MFSAYCFTSIFFILSEDGWLRDNQFVLFCPYTILFSLIYEEIYVVSSIVGCESECFRDGSWEYQGFVNIAILWKFLTSTIKRNMVNETFSNSMNYESLRNPESRTWLIAVDTKKCNIRKGSQGITTRTDRPIFTQNTNQTANLNFCFFRNRSRWPGSEENWKNKDVMQFLDLRVRVRVRVRVISTIEICVNTSVIEMFTHEYRISAHFESAFGSIDSVSVLFRVCQTDSGFFPVGRFASSVPFQVGRFESSLFSGTSVRFKYWAWNWTEPELPHPSWSYLRVNIGENRKISHRVDGTVSQNLLNFWYVVEDKKLCLCWNFQIDSIKWRSETAWTNFEFFSVCFSTIFSAISPSCWNIRLE